MSGARACGRGCASLWELPAPEEQGEGQGDPRQLLPSPGAGRQRCLLAAPQCCCPRCCHHRPAPCTPTQQVSAFPSIPRCSLPGMASWQSHSLAGALQPLPKWSATRVPELLAKFAGLAGCVSLGEQLGFPFPLSGLRSRELAGRQEGGTFHFSAVPRLYWAEGHLLSRFSSTAPRRGMKPKSGTWGISWVSF